MNAPGCRTDIAEIFSILIPYGCADGRLAMLRAYFDDSGTHDASGIVVVAGVMGTEFEIRTLENLWKEVLDDPVCGIRPPLEEFHASHCYHSDEEFKGWKRVETDFLRHRLREVMIKSRVGVYGFACVRSEWDSIIQGNLRDVFGNPEDFAMRNCFVGALNWSVDRTFDKEIAFVFDDSDYVQRKIDILAVYRAFKKQHPWKNLNGSAFIDSRKREALQAADLFAWEFNQSAKILLGGNGDDLITDALRHLQKLDWLGGKIARRDKIQMNER